MSMNKVEIDLVEARAEAAVLRAEAAVLREALAAWRTWCDSPLPAPVAVRRAIELTDKALFSDAGRTALGEVKKLRAEIGDLVAARDADALLLEQAAKDQQKLRSELAHITQIVHHAYHQDQQHTWRECPIGVCADVQAMLGEEAAP